VAFPVDWPSWSQGAKSPELALETLGRDRDQIIRHTIRTESEEFALTPQGLHDFRDGYVATITG